MDGTKDTGLSFGKQFVYGLTELASNPIYTIALSFLTYFYTDILGLNPAVVGGIILASRIFDGISDIAAGNMIDHTRTAKGSARPWILRMIVPMVIAYVTLFTVPHFSALGKAVYIFVSYNFSYTVVYTIYYAAISVLPVYMTNDTKSRSAAYSIRIIVGGFLQVVLSMVFLQAIEAMGGGQDAWIKISAVLAVISAIGMLIVYFRTEEKNNARVTAAGENGTKEDVPLLDALKMLAHNKYWFLALGIQIVQVLHQVLTLTIGVYFAKYVLNDVLLAGNLVLYHSLPSIISLPIITVLLAKGVSKRDINIVGAIFMILGTVVAMFSVENLAVVISLVLRGAGYSCLCATVYGMVADSIDYGEWRSHVRCEAVSTSANSVAQKIGTGLGTAAFGALLAYFGYSGTADVQPAAAVSCIKAMFVYAPLAIYVILMILLMAYKLDKELPRIQKDLAERKTTSA